MLITSFGSISQKLREQYETILVDTHAHTVASTHAYSTVAEYFQKQN